MSTICNTNPVSTSLRGRRVVGAGRTLRRAPSLHKFKLRLCERSGRCRPREVTGPLPPSRIRRATALLTRAGHTYGRGTYTRGHTQLHMRRLLKAGTYKLTLVEHPPASQRIGPGRLSAINTILPITIG